MRNLEPPENPNLIIGAEGFSDASVYRLADGTLMVQSLDFFPPIVDDPYLFGQIAAANSLSDIFAMGAEPVTALNIVCFPDDALPLEVLTEILRGGDSKVREAGGATAGGHTVRDTEIKYGLSVTGLCTEDELLHNSGAMPGDVLVLTKPLGTGFISTAMKAKKATAASASAATTAMATLNQHAAAAAKKYNASSTTDITGFGLAGHAIEMANGSNVTLEIDLDSLPVLEGALDAFQRGYVTRASKSNRVANEAEFTGLENSRGPEIELLFDPQTSGGLLVAIPEKNIDSFLQYVCEHQPQAPIVIGRVKDRADKAIEV